MDNKTRDDALRNAFQKAVATKDLNKLIEKQFRDNINACGIEVTRYRDNGKPSSFSMNFVVEDVYDFRAIRGAITGVCENLGYKVLRVDRVKMRSVKRNTKIYKAHMLGGCPKIVYGENEYERTMNRICQHIADSLYDFVINFRKGRLPFEDGLKRMTIENFMYVATKLNPAPLYFYEARSVYTAVIDYLHKNILPRGEKYSVDFDGEIIGKEYHYRLTIIMK